MSLTDIAELNERRRSKKYKIKRNYVPEIELSEDYFNKLNEEKGILSEGKGNPQYEIIE